jgi:hypothetical protein
MPTVVFESWRPGLRKISLQKAIADKSDATLGRAHDLVHNRLMRGESFTVFVDDPASAKELVRIAEELGATARIVDE